MQLIQRLLTALWSAIVRALRFWARDIAQRKSLAGKAVSGCLGLLVVLCVCSLGLSAVRSAGETAGLVPTRAPGTVRRGATPGAQCSIVVRYKSGPSQAQGLGAKKADADGDVSWSWKVHRRRTEINRRRFDLM